MPEIRKLDNGFYLIIAPKPNQAIMDELAKMGKLPGEYEGAVVVSEEWLIDNFDSDKVTFA